MKKVLIIITAFTLTSCLNEPLKTIETNNNNFDVQLLFKLDCCSVYRFKDAGSYRYFVTNGSINWTTTEGKNNHVYHEVLTSQTATKK